MRKTTVQPQLWSARVLSNSLLPAQTVVFRGVTFNVFVTKSSSGIEGGEGAQNDLAHYFTVSLHTTSYSVGLKGNI